MSYWNARGRPEVLVYFLVSFALLVASHLRMTPSVERFAWGFAWLFMVVFIGLRNHVGMDWNNYLHMTAWIDQVGIPGAFDRAEPAYVLLTHLSLQLGMGVYGVNLVIAVIFVSGLFSLCARTPNKWLALAVAYPVLIVVVANSATRQAAAIGILLWLVGSWDRLGLVARVLAVLAAASFHYSAIVFLAVVVIDMRGEPYLKLFAIVLVTAVTVYLLQQLEDRTRYFETYVLDQKPVVVSPGALLHVILNAVPAAALLLLGRWRASLVPNRIVYYLALACLLLLPLTASYSTAASRFSYYLFPVSICVLAAIPGIVRGAGGRLAVSVAIALALVLELWLWLNYANNRHAYIPYRNLLSLQDSRPERVPI